MKKEILFANGERISYEETQIRRFDTPPKTTAEMLGKVYRGVVCGLRTAILMEPTDLQKLEFYPRAEDHH